MWEIPQETQPCACGLAPVLERGGHSPQLPNPPSQGPGHMWESVRGRRGRPEIVPFGTKASWGDLGAWAGWCTLLPGARPPAPLLTSSVLSSLAPKASMSSLRELVGPEM